MFLPAIGDHQQVLIRKKIGCVSAPFQNTNMIVPKITVRLSDGLPLLWRSGCGWHGSWFRDTRVNCGYKSDMDLSLSNHVSIQIIITANTVCKKHSTTWTVLVYQHHDKHHFSLENRIWKTNDTHRQHNLLTQSCTPTSSIKPRPHRRRRMEQIHTSVVYKGCAVAHIVQTL